VFQRNGSHASEALSREEIAYFRDHLLLMRTRLLEEAERTAQGMGGEDAQGFPDPTDRGVLESERNLTLRIRDRERKLLGKIDEALERIEQGSFGKCEECSEPIGGERLRVRPVTTLCIRCKEEQEERERVARR
jgi:DnaK suppressor protein